MLLHVKAPEKCLTKLSVIVAASTHPFTCQHLFLFDPKLEFQHFRNTIGTKMNDLDLCLQVV